MATSKILKNSTALTLVLTLGFTSPASYAFAQEGGDQTVDCEADPANPACAEATPTEEAAPAEEAPAAEELPAEEAAPAEEPAAEEAPAEEPAAQPEAEAAPAGEPVTEEAPMEQPATEEAPVEEPAAEAPAAEQPAAEEMPAAEEVPAEEPTAEQPPVEEAAPEQPATEEPAPEQPAAAEPAGEQPAATEETATEEPAAEEPVAEQPATQEPASQEPAAATAEPEAAEPVGEPVEVTEPAEPLLVVPDETTEAQEQQLRAEEEQRREEARKRRNELLGAAAVGVGIGMLVPALGGKVVGDEGDRIIVERDGEYYVRKDENSLLREGDAEVTIQRLRGGRTLETVTRENGVRIETVRDEGGFILRRSRILPDGREYVLIDNRQRDDRRRVDYDRRLPPLRIDIPRDRYIVPARQANREVIYETFAAPPVEAVENAYTLREVRESERLRAKVRRVDLDTITFETGSAIVRESQVPLLEELARAALALIEQDPSTVLLVEGHTDAVGSDVYNLALSDRRAETVARILVVRYGLPPENLVVQGYGEQFLKVNTEAAERQNRRVTLRNITPLLSASQ